MVYRHSLLPSLLSNRVSEGGINETADEMKHSCDSHDV